MTCVKGHEVVMVMGDAEMYEDAMLMQEGESCPSACVEERKGDWRRPRRKKNVQNQSPRRL